MTRRKVQAWAWFNSEGIAPNGVFFTKYQADHNPPFMHLSLGYQLRRVVEHEPGLEALAKAAVAALEILRKPKHPHSRAESAIAILQPRVERLLKSRARRKR